MISEPPNVMQDDGYIVRVDLFAGFSAFNVSS